jgi:hypothetical protein
MLNSDKIAQRAKKGSDEATAHAMKKSALNGVSTEQRAMTLSSAYANEMWRLQGA